MNEELQKQIIGLVLAAMQGNLEAAEQIQKIFKAAEQGNLEALTIALMIQSVMDLLKIKARFGAKLNYLNRLKGKCPEGEELVYFKVGGKTCTKCLKKR